MTLIEQLKERYPILAMVEKLGMDEGRRGAKILCPFHNDTHPSLHLYLDQDRWQCFVCDKGGDQLDLWAEVHSLPLAVAIKDLATAEGLDYDVEWGTLKPKEPAPAELLGRVASQAHLEVLRALARDNPEARGAQAWVPLVTAAFIPYDELLRRYRNLELKAEDTTELLIIWWKWQTGGQPHGGDLRRLWTVLGDPRAEAGVLQPPKPTPQICRCHADDSLYGSLLECPDCHHRSFDPIGGDCERRACSSAVPTPSKTRWNLSPRRT